MDRPASLSVKNISGKPLRILIFGQYFWPESFQINALAQTLVDNGHTVEVLTGKPNYPDGVIFPGYQSCGCLTETWNGMKIFRIPIVVRGKGNIAKLLLNYLSFILSGLLFAPWMLRGKAYDVIFVYAPSPIFQSIPASFLGWIKRCPVVLWVQDLWPDTLHASGHVRSSVLLNWVAKLVSFTYSHTDLLLVQSHAFTREVTALAPGKRVLYFPNSVDPAFHNPPEMELPDIPALNSGFRVVFAGNLGWLQTVEVIVKAANLLRDYTDIRFVMLGSGSRSEWMQQEAKSLGLNNLYFAGRHPMDTMPGLMSKASVLLVTLGDQKSLNMTVPSKLQAYMATGRPIVACINGEGAHLVKESKAGLAVPAENSAALADAILSLYRMSTEQREKYGKNGRAYYMQHFNHDRLVGQLIDHFRQLTER